MTISNDILETLKGLVIFKINNEEYCFDIRNISAILKPYEIDKNSALKPEKQPCISFADEKFIMVDMHEIFGVRYSGINSDTRVILIEIFDKKIAFWVDKVKEIVTLDRIFIEKSLRYKPYNNNSFISGILEIQDRKIKMPNFNKIANELKQLSGNPVSNFNAGMKFRVMNFLVA